MSAPVRGADLALVILAAGRAKRYGGCKPLAPVGPQGEAVIDLSVEGDAVPVDLTPNELARVEVTLG